MVFTIFKNNFPNSICFPLVFFSTFNLCLVSETCLVLDSLIQYHVYNLPFLIDKGKEEAKKNFQFAVAKSTSQGISLLLGVVTDIGYVFFLFKIIKTIINPF